MKWVNRRVDAECVKADKGERTDGWVKRECTDRRINEVKMD
jgi:hypothetical protein